MNVIVPQRWIRIIFVFRIRMSHRKSDLGALLNILYFKNLLVPLTIVDSVRETLLHSLHYWKIKIPDPDEKSPDIQD